MVTLRTEPVQRGLDALARQGLEWHAFVEGATELLGTAVPYDAACIGPIDPDTGLLTGSVKRNLGDEMDAEFLRHEYVTDEVNLFLALARRERPVGILADDTGGDPRRSSRHRDVFVPHWALDHEMRAIALADGTPWAAVALYRSGAAGGFSPAEADFLGRVSRTIALGVRAGLVTAVAASAAGGPGTPATGPAVLVVEADDAVSRLSPAAEARLAELGGSGWGALPNPVAAITAAARALGAGRLGTVPRLRVRTPAGEWLVVHAAPLTGPDGRACQVVVTIEEARPPEIVPLVVAAFGLTGREQEVVAAVLQGESTQEIGRALHLSPWTVQDHLKAVFEKAGVGSRRELVARVFFDHYAPRLSDRIAPGGFFAGA
ncbi:helix-turn-helix transcriptional regulator [Cellulomonas sp. IC4_254]|uniref:helix-turn-helix transcriptional regulator n=1 Tax=Cellulomonas sp. IC4_254 TaxID=2714040 RepID=UPI001424774A|nr:helix-turn-helix transcriptional regulator [Cellulomonas sp. IC4_254]NHT18620.1 LuxR family transcriptional regulator [Cellulomonas sp. IC4_254]